MGIGPPPGIVLRIEKFVGATGDGDFTFKVNPEDVQEALEYFKPDAEYTAKFIQAGHEQHL